MKSGVSLITLSRGEVDFVSGVGPASVNGTLVEIPSRAIWISQNRRHTRTRGSDRAMCEYF
jgi:hypothetical protein